MSKAAKKRLAGCKERAEAILEILNSKKASADVVEFTNTLRFALNVIDDFVKTKSKMRPPVSDDGVRIENLLKEYEELITQLVNTQRFLRFFTSNRVRKKLDLINSQVHREFAQIFLGLQDQRKRMSKNPKILKKPGKDDKDNQTNCIKDEEGRVMWETYFDQSIMVDWIEFLMVFKKTLPFPLDEEMEKQLRYILDNSNTGYVSVFKFSDFLNGFGPLKTSISKTQAVLNNDWFHGFLSSHEAERLLERQPPGTFLIRFSKSKAGSFAIAYVDATQRNTITHTLITCSPPSGFKIEEAYNRNARGRLFDSLNEVVEFYNYLLKMPFKSDLSRQPWFHGDLTSQESEEILAGEPEGAFMFRFSSKAGFLAVSYINNGVVKHGLLESLPGGYKFDNNPPVYPTLDHVISDLNDILKKPLNALTYAKANVVTNTPTQQPSEYTSFRSKGMPPPSPANSSGTPPQAQPQFARSNTTPQATPTPTPVQSPPQTPPMSPNDPRAAHYLNSGTVTASNPQAQVTSPKGTLKNHVIPPQNNLNNANQNNPQFYGTPAPVPQFYGTPSHVSGLGGEYSSTLAASNPNLHPSSNPQNSPPVTRPNPVQSNPPPAPQSNYGSTNLYGTSVLSSAALSQYQSSQPPVNNMPIGANNYQPSPALTIRTMSPPPSSSPVNINIPPPVQNPTNTASPSNYAQMPRHMMGGQTNSNSSSPNTSSGNLPKKSEYDSIKLSQGTLGNSTSSEDYGEMPNSQAILEALKAEQNVVGNKTTLASRKTSSTGTPPVTESNYGRMPNSPGANSYSSYPVSPSPSNQSSPSSSDSNYGNMPAFSPTLQRNVSTTNVSNTSKYEYGSPANVPGNKMSLGKLSQLNATQMLQNQAKQPQPTNDNYGHMPSIPGSSPSTIRMNTPPQQRSSLPLANDNYGHMPSVSGSPNVSKPMMTNTPPNDNYGHMPTIAKTNSATNIHTPSSYGIMPKGPANTPMSSTPPTSSLNHTLSSNSIKQPVQLASTRTQGGSAISQTPPTNTGLSRNNSSNQIEAPSQQTKNKYRLSQQPQNFQQNNGAQNNPPAQVAYGKMPTNPNANQIMMGGSRIGSFNQNTSLSNSQDEVDYGALPSVDINALQNLSMQSPPPPITNYNRSLSNFNVPVVPNSLHASNYRSLNSNGIVIEESEGDYGGLPPNPQDGDNEYDNIPVMDNAYMQRNEYGGLPPEYQENDYGGLPAMPPMPHGTVEEEDYGGLPY